MLKMSFASALLLAQVFLLVSCSKAQQQPFNTFVYPNFFSVKYPSSCSLLHDDVYGTLELHCGENLPRLDMSHITDEPYTSENRKDIAIKIIMDLCRHGRPDHEVRCSNPVQVSEGKTNNDLPYVRFFLTSTVTGAGGKMLSEDTVGPLYAIEVKRKEKDWGTLLTLLPRQIMDDGISPFKLVQNDAMLRSVVQSIGKQ